MVDQCCHGEQDLGMLRLFHFQYPGATYHAIARGDKGKTAFENKDDCVRSVADCIHLYPSQQ
jgi:hypothetical protein